MRRVRVGSKLDLADQVALPLSQMAVVRRQAHPLRQAECAPGEGRQPGGAAVDDGAVFGFVPEAGDGGLEASVDMLLKHPLSVQAMLVLSWRTVVRR